MATALLEPRTVAANAPTRRHLLAAMAVVPAVALPAAGAARISGPLKLEQSPTGFDAAHSRWARARAASIHFGATTYDPVARAHTAARDSLPHASFDYECFGGTRTLTTADAGDLAVAQACLREAAYRSVSLPGYLDACRNVIAASERRGVELDHLYDASGLSAINARFDELEEERYAATWALFEVPATDGRQLAAKIKAMAAEDLLDLAGAREALLADADRLAGEA